MADRPVDLTAYRRNGVVWLERKPSGSEGVEALEIGGEGSRDALAPEAARALGRQLLAAAGDGYERTHGQDHPEARPYGGGAGEQEAKGL